MNRITDLEKRILEARDAYYNSDVPIMSDKSFDALVDELRELDPNNRAVIMVGAPLRPSEWKKAKHLIPMGSLDKVNTPSEMSEWAKVADGENLFVCEKLDGLSIEVIYEDGKFVQAITRGTGGLEGEDITVNVAKMGGVRSHLKHKFTGSLRGEIIMYKSTHKQWFSDKANPRNAASGTSKRLDGVGVDKLNILFYQVLGDVDFKTEAKQFEWLHKQGLDTPNYWVFDNATQVNEHWRKYQDTDREKLDYDIDGLVVRVNSMELQLSFGEKDLRPKGAIAFKFDNEARESTIKDIIWQVGNSGRITPVAIVEPVQLVGATVTRASIYNMAYIEELGLGIGARVLVARANDVIPRIEELIKGTGKTTTPPNNCPDCGTQTYFEGENLVCKNVKGCRSQIIGRLKNWVKELNLLEWGDTLLEKLVDAKKVKTVADLYTLKVDDIANLDRLGEKTAKKCLGILDDNKEISLEVFLGALSIPLIGQSTIKLLIKAGCDSLEKFGQLDTNAFSQVAGVGPVKAQSLADGLKHNRQLILDLLANGVKIKEIIDGKLTGKSFAITGTLSIKRAEVEKLIKDNGGEIKGSVGKGLTYLIISDPQSTSSKAQAARKLGTTLIDEKQFLALVK